MLESILSSAVIKLLQKVGKQFVKQEVTKKLSKQSIKRVAQLKKSLKESKKFISVIENPVSTINTKLKNQAELYLLEKHKNDLSSISNYYNLYKEYKDVVSDFNVERFVEKKVTRKINKMVNKKIKNLSLKIKWLAKELEVTPQEIKDNFDNTDIETLTNNEYYKNYERVNKQNKVNKIPKNVEKVNKVDIVNKVNKKSKSFTLNYTEYVSNLLKSLASARENALLYGQSTNKIDELIINIQNLADEYGDTYIGKYLHYLNSRNYLDKMINDELFSSDNERVGRVIVDERIISLLKEDSPEFENFKFIEPFFNEEYKGDEYFIDVEI